MVHETNYKSTNVTDAVIKDSLKKAYKQAVFEFIVTRQPEKTVAFDLDRDGKLDTSVWNTAEMLKVISECKDDSYDLNIFLVDKGSFRGGNGFMSFNQRYGFVHADNSSRPGQTITHELGHGGFGINHTPTDNNNLMYDYIGDIWQLRKNQWDQIQR